MDIDQFTDALVTALSDWRTFMMAVIMGCLYVGFHKILDKLCE